MATCRSCQAPIVWVETEGTEKRAGRAMPLNGDPERPGKALKAADGNIVFTGARSANGTWIVRYVGAGPGRYRSHFASCPHATEHRRSR